jgi:16S rRNA processing protein RimM
VSDPFLDEFVCIGEALGPHGIKGAVWIRFFTSDSRTLLKIKELVDEKQKRYAVSLNLGGRTDAVLRAQLEGVNTRNDAETIKGKLFFVRKETLAPLEEEEFYYIDLMGLKVQNLNGLLVGHVLTVHNFGAQDTLEIKPSSGSKTIYVPFTKVAVPVVDVSQGFVVVEDAYLNLNEGSQKNESPDLDLEKE